VIEDKAKIFVRKEEKGLRTMKQGFAGETREGDRANRKAKLRNLVNKKRGGCTEKGGEEREGSSD
jgi:hypothetical protein